ncbi:hypothetical protein REPUB_Repub18cG0041000 [Reevesia pubescens]
MDSRWCIGIVHGVWENEKIVQAETEVVNIVRQNETNLVHIGAVLDLKSPTDRMVKVCLTMALSKFYTTHSNYRTKLILHTRDSSNDLFDTASSASSPTPSLSNNPYFIKIGQDDSSQVKAITRLLQKFGWEEVVFIYEDIGNGNEIFSCVANSLQDINVRVTHKCIISSEAKESQILNEIKMLKRMQARVFIVHMTVELGSRFFVLANREKMMSKGYAWLITGGLSLSLDLEAKDPLVFDSMEGVLGIQPHVPKSENLDKFHWRYNRQQYSMSNPNMTSELNIFGLWAYDTVWALALAAERVGVGTMDSSIFKDQKTGTCSTNLPDLGTSKIGPSLLEEVSNISFRGLSGHFQLVNRQLQARALEVFNVVGKGKSRVIGYWTPESGILTKNLGSSRRQSLNSTSMNELKSILWPGDSTETPSALGWATATDGKSLTIGVPTATNFTEFVNLDKYKGYEMNNDEYLPGFSLEVFEAVWNALPSKLAYQFRSFNGSYDDLCEQVYNKAYDAVVGDITIMAKRTKWVDFTSAYLDSRVTMLIKVGHKRPNHIWTFFKPLSWDLWVIIYISCISVGLVVRILERRVNTEFKGPAGKQICTILLFPFQSVVIPQREMVTTYWAKVVLVTWLFLAFVIMQSYTANLSSILTVDRLQGTVPSLMELRKSYVGYHDQSFVKDFLVNELKLNTGKLKPYASVEEMYSVLSNGGVAAIFDEIPYIKVFLTKYSSGFKMVGPTYKTNGFGFAFLLGSSLTPIVSRAILNVTQGKVMSNIEKKYFNTEDIYGGQTEPPSSTSSSLTSKSFGGLFIVGGITLLLALLFSETHVWKRFDVRYILRASPHQNTESRVQPKVDY